MIKITELKNYLSANVFQVILSDKHTAFNLKEKFHKNFSIVSLILLSTFSLGVLFSAYISYSLTGAMLVGFSGNREMSNSFQENISPLSFSVIKKNVISRNFFNQTGEIPVEDTSEGSESSLMKNFEKAPCVTNDKLPVELLGIIYTGNPSTNLVSIKDSTATIADVYKEGQELIDYENYSLYKVTSPTTAEFRHDSKKICASLNPPSYNTENLPTNFSAGVEISLEPSFVKEQLGAGFSTILNSARLVPQIIDGKTLGFKIFAIAKGSLFDKIELMNGDVIKNVNGTNLEDPAQGFKVYEAFQNENEITLHIQRNNETLTKKVVVQ
ncbi:MAG: hypothetical protein V4591_05525 [Bdellovibrionota bacterium]